MPVDAQLAQQISQISGVAQVIIGGQQKPAIRVQIDPAKLVAKGLSLEDVRSQIAITTVDSPKGNIDGDHARLHHLRQRPAAGFKDWNDVIIAYRNGGPLRIRDIGQAVTGPEDAKQAAWANGKRGVFLVVYKQPGANVIDTVDKIKATLPRLVAAIPPAIKIELISDRTQTIRAAVEDVQFTLLLTIALVVMVIFLFLRSFWATVIPAITVPLALLGACALMWVFGYTLDNLSLDGADDRGRLRGRRRHRDAGKHLALHRGRRTTAGGRLQGRRARSASPSSRSASRWSRC